MSISRIGKNKLVIIYSVSLLEHPEFVPSRVKYHNEQNKKYLKEIKEIFMKILPDRDNYFSIESSQSSGAHYIKLNSLQQMPYFAMLSDVLKMLKK